MAIKDVNTKNLANTQKLTAAKKAVTKPLENQAKAASVPVSRAPSAPIGDDYARILAMKAANKMLDAIEMGMNGAGIEGASGAASENIKETVDNTKKAVAAKKAAKKKGGCGGIMDKVVGIASLALNFIPGIGTAASIALQVLAKGKQILDAIKKGDWKSVLMGAVSAVAGAMGGPVGSAVDKVVSIAQKAQGLFNAVKKGDWAGAIGMVAGAFGGKAGAQIAEAASVAKAVENQDYGGALGALGALSGSEDLEKIGDLYDTGKGIERGLENGDYGAAAKNLGKILKK